MRKANNLIASYIRIYFVKAAWTEIVVWAFFSSLEHLLTYVNIADNICFDICQKGWIMPKITKKTT